MSEMSDALLAALWRASWQGGLVIAVLWCFCRALEKGRWFSADLRCWLWRTAYIKLLVSLAVSSSIVLPILPAAEMPEPLSAASPSPGEAGKTTIATAIPATVPVPEPLVVSPGFSWQEAVLIVYLLGVSVCLVRVARAGFRTRHVLREAAPSGNADTEAENARLANQLGLRRAPRLRTSADIAIPVYAGGTILLPTGANYTPDERRLVLAHELAHARRRDLVWEWVGTLTQIVFFFHPLVLLARREERLARESAADALALRTTGASSAAYGKLLLAVSCSRPEPPLLGAVGVIENGSALRRRLLHLDMYGFTISRKRRVGIAVLASCISPLVILPWTAAQTGKWEPHTNLTTKEPIKPFLQLGRGTVDSSENFVVVALYRNLTGKDTQWLLHGTLYRVRNGFTEKLWDSQSPSTTNAADSLQYRSDNELVDLWGYSSGSSSALSDPGLRRKHPLANEDAHSWGFWRRLPHLPENSRLEFVVEAVAVPVAGGSRNGDGVIRTAVSTRQATQGEFAAARKLSGARYLRTSLILSAKEDSRSNTDQGDIARETLTSGVYSTPANEEQIEMVIQARRVTRVASGILLEGATVTRYKGERVVSQMTTSRAVFRIKPSYIHGNLRTGENIKFEIDPKYVGEIRASKGEIPRNVTPPEKAPAR